LSAFCQNPMATQPLKAWENARRDQTTT
jgi:hypothetical protein